MKIPRKVVKDVAVVAIGVLGIWLGLQAAFGTPNPFYVVASGSMVPELEVHDVIVVQGHHPFEDVKPDDIIVFDRPSDRAKVIVHRVTSIISEDPKQVRTKGDANSGSIPGTDWPITEREYIGRVIESVPAIGYVTQALQPPVNYIIIVVVVGIMAARHFSKSRSST